MAEWEKPRPRGVPHELAAAIEEFGKDASVSVTVAVDDIERVRELISSEYALMEVTPPGADIQRELIVIPNEVAELAQQVLESGKLEVVDGQTGIWLDMEKVDELFRKHGRGEA